MSKTARACVCVCVNTAFKEQSKRSETSVLKLEKTGPAFVSDGIVHAEETEPGLNTKGMQ